MKIVTAGIIEKNGKIHIARRKQGNALEHKWEFPGGKIELGETPEQCLAHELMEEFGGQTQVSVFICSSIFAYEHISIQRLLIKLFTFPINFSYPIMKKLGGWLL